MEAIALAAALFTADAAVRESEAFALAGELGRFPPPEVIARDRQRARDHLEYCERVHVAGPLLGVISDEYLDQQKLVARAYGHVENARCYVHDFYQYGEGWEGGNEYADAGRMDNLKAELASLRHLLGELDYIYGRMPAPLP